MDGTQEMTEMYQPLTGDAPVTKLSMWHVMIVDWRLLHPSENWSKCATYFDVTSAWLSRIINSDLFKGYYTKRMQEHQKLVSEEIVAVAGKTALTGLTLMEKKMSEEALMLGLGEVSDATEMAMKSLGFGVKPAQGQGVQVAVNFGAIDPAALAEARGAMKAIGRANTLRNAEEAVEVVEEATSTQTLPEPPTIEELEAREAVLLRESEKPAKPAIEEKEDEMDKDLDFLREVYEDPV